MKNMHRQLHRNSGENGVLQSEQSGERDDGVKIPVGLNRGRDFPFIHKRRVQGHVPRSWKPPAFFTNLIYDLSAYAGLSLDFHDEHRHAGLYEKVDLASDAFPFAAAPTIRRG